MAEPFQPYQFDEQWQRIFGTRTQDLVPPGSVPFGDTSTPMGIVDPQNVRDPQKAQQIRLKVKQRYKQKFGRDPSEAELDDLLYTGRTGRGAAVTPTLQARQLEQQGSIAARQQAFAEYQYSQEQETGLEESLGFRTIPKIDAKTMFQIDPSQYMRDGEVGPDSQSQLAFRQAKERVRQSFQDVFRYDPPPRVVEKLARGEVVSGMALPTVTGQQVEFQQAQITGEYRGEPIADMILAKMDQDTRLKIYGGWDEVDEEGNTVHIWGQSELDKLKHDDRMEWERQLVTGFTWVDPETNTKQRVLGRDELADLDWRHELELRGGVSYVQYEYDDAGNATPVLDENDDPVIVTIMGDEGLSKYQIDVQADLQEQGLEDTDARFFAQLAVDRKRYEGYWVPKRDANGRVMYDERTHSTKKEFVIGTVGLQRLANWQEWKILQEQGRQRLREIEAAAEVEEETMLLSERLRRVAQSSETITVIDPITEAEVEVRGEQAWQEWMMEEGLEQDLRRQYGGWVAITSPERTMPDGRVIPERTDMIFVAGAQTHEKRMEAMRQQLVREGWDEDRAQREAERHLTLVDKWGGWVYDPQAEGGRRWIEGTIMSNERLQELAQKHDMDVIEIQARIDERIVARARMHDLYIMSQQNRFDRSEAEAERDWRSYENDLDRQLRESLQEEMGIEERGGVTERDRWLLKTQREDAIIESISQLAPEFGHFIWNLFDEEEVSTGDPVWSQLFWMNQFIKAGREGEYTEEDAAKAAQAFNTLREVVEGGGGGTLPVPAVETQEAPVERPGFVDKFASWIPFSYTATQHSALVGSLATAGILLGGAYVLYNVGSYWLNKDKRSKREKKERRELEAAYTGAFDEWFQNLPAAQQQLVLKTMDESDRPWKDRFAVAMLIEEYTIRQAQDSGRLSPVTLGTTTTGYDRYVSVANENQRNEVDNVFSTMRDEITEQLNPRTVVQSQWDLFEQARTLLDNDTITKSYGELSVGEEAVVRSIWRQLPGEARSASSLSELQGVPEKVLEDVAVFMGTLDVMSTTEWQQALESIEDDLNKPVQEWSTETAALAERLVTQGGNIVLDTLQFAEMTPENQQRTWQQLWEGVPEGGTPSRVERLKAIKDVLRPTWEQIGTGEYTKLPGDVSIPEISSITSNLRRHGDTALATALEERLQEQTALSPQEITRYFGSVTVSQMKYPNAYRRYVEVAQDRGWRQSVAGSVGRQRR